MIIIVFCGRVFILGGFELEICLVRKVVINRYFFYTFVFIDLCCVKRFDVEERFEFCLYLGFRYIYRLFRKNREGRWVGELEVN